MHHIITVLIKNTYKLDNIDDEIDKKIKLEEYLLKVVENNPIINIEKFTEEAINKYN